MGNPSGKALSILIPELDANCARAQELCDGISPEQFNWNPEPGRWSIGQNLSHLTMVNGGDVQALRTAIKSGLARGIMDPGPFDYGFLSRKFIESMEPPVSRKFKAPAYYLPQPQLDRDQTVSAYLRVMTEIRTLACSAAGLDLARVKTILPALPAILQPFLKMPLGARLQLLNTHDRRHLCQAETVRKQLP